VWRTEREKSYLKDEGRARKEQVQYAFCYDSTQFNSIVPNYITAVRDNGEKVVEVGSKEYKLVCKLDLDQCRALHAWLVSHLQCDETAVEEEEEEGKNESNNEVPTEVEFVNVQVKQD
jgi:hypothetical protein